MSLLPVVSLINKTSRLRESQSKAAEISRRPSIFSIYSKDERQDDLSVIAKRRMTQFGNQNTLPLPGQPMWNRMGNHLVRKNSIIQTQKNYPTYHQPVDDPLKSSIKTNITHLDSEELDQIIKEVEEYKQTEKNNQRFKNFSTFGQPKYKYTTNSKLSSQNSFHPQTRGSFIASKSSSRNCIYPKGVENSPKSQLSFKITPKQQYPDSNNGWERRQVQHQELFRNIASIQENHKNNSTNNLNFSKQVELRGKADDQINYTPQRNFDSFEDDKNFAQNYSMRTQFKNKTRLDFLDISQVPNQEESSNNLLNSFQSQKEKQGSSCWSCFFKRKKSSKNDKYRQNEFLKRKNTGFMKFSQEKRKKRIKELWQSAFRKITLMIKFVKIFNDIADDIYKYGITMGKHDLKLLTEGGELEQTKKRADCVIMPECKFKIVWNLIMILLLLYTAAYVPYRTAFVDNVSYSIEIMEYISDSIFGMDIFITFFSAYYDDDHILVTSKCPITLNYLRSWFLLDLMACFPFYLLENDNLGTNYNELLRLARLPRLYKLVRILRLIKMVRLLKYSTVINKVLNQAKMNAGILRLLRTLITVLFFVHLFTCSWYFIAKIDDFNFDTWVVRYGLIDATDSQLYLASAYWVLQTLTTVGFGDIHAETHNERLMALILMIFGVGFYSFTIGNLSSILANIDIQRQQLTEKLQTCNEFSIKAKLPEEITSKIRNYFE